MVILKRGIPITLAVFVGLATLAGLLFFPPLSSLILSWAGFLAAAALLMGVYSLALVVSIVVVLGLYVTDSLGETDRGVELVFHTVQVPLESALASLVAFFLLFAGVRMLRDRRDLSTILFLISTLFFLLVQVPLSAAIAGWLVPLRNWIEVVVVASGVRGLLLGIALGILILAVRLLVGLERPYSS
jgi:hypothetical protein